MKIFAAVGLFIISLPIAAIEKYCFENTDAKTKILVTFSTQMNRVEGGIFKILSLKTGSSLRTSRFHGTKSGTVLAISFKGKIPYKKPQGDNTVIWILDGQKLQIAMRGQKDTPFTPCSR